MKQWTLIQLRQYCWWTSWLVLCFATDVTVSAWVCVKSCVFNLWQVDNLEAYCWCSHHRFLILSHMHKSTEGSKWSIKLCFQHENNVSPGLHYGPNHTIKAKKGNGSKGFCAKGLSSILLKIKHNLPSFLELNPDAWIAIWKYSKSNLE